MMRFRFLSICLLTILLVSSWCRYGDGQQVKTIHSAAARIGSESQPASTDRAYTEDEIRKFCTELTSPNYQAREQAMQNLVSAGFDVVPELCELITRGNPEQSWRATKILIQVGIARDEEQVAKLTRILHLLGTNGHPSLLKEAQQARQTWSTYQINKTIRQFKSLGAEVSVGGGGFASGGFAGRRDWIMITENRSGSRQTNTNQTGTGTENIQTATRLSADKLKKEIDQILVASSQEDDEAIVKIFSQPKTQRTVNLEQAFQNQLDAQSVKLLLGGSASAGQGISIKLDRKWKGTVDDFKQLARLPQVGSVHFENIKVEDQMIDVLDHVSVSTLQLIKCEFNSERVREFADKHPETYLNVRGKALLGVRGPIAGRATVNNNNANEADCEISEVIRNSAADRAGVRVGDVIEAVDDREVNSFQQLVFEIAGRKIGTSVTLKISRGGETKLLELKLGDSSDPNVDVDD